MDAALDDIAFLANSENRVTVLGTLVDAPHGRDDILGQIDASRVTVTRILRELEDRDWIERTGRDYTATPTGDWVYEEFTRLVEELEAEQRLREPLQWLPDDVVTFDIQCLRDAEVILLDGRDTTVIVRRIVEFHRSGDRIRGVARQAAPVFIENHWELTVHGGTRLELVLTPGALEVIRNHQPSAQRLREMLDEDSAHYFVYEDIPVSVGIVDGAVGINLADEQGVVRGGLVTENENVRAWAVDLFETCRDRARPVEPEEMPV